VQRHVGAVRLLERDVAVEAVVPAAKDGDLAIGQSGAGVGTYRQNARKSEGTKAADVTACSAFAKHFFARVPPTVPVRAVVFGGKGARAALTMPLIFRFLYLAQKLYR
jgi:hypothetical protein